MHVGVYAIEGSEDYLVILGNDKYRMAINPDLPHAIGICTDLKTTFIFSYRLVDQVPIGIVKQIAYLLRRDCQIKINKALESLTDYLDDDGGQSNYKGE